jgi:hypothetical protein
MLDSLPEETQLVLVFIAIAVLFLIVMHNNRRNRSKRYDRKGFRSGYYEKKKKKRK